MNSTGDNFPDSPCIRNCCLDKNDICLGCGRKLVEILEWHSASKKRKKDICDSAKTRCEERKLPWT